MKKHLDLRGIIMLILAILFSQSVRATDHGTKEVNVGDIITIYNSLDDSFLILSWNWSKDNDNIQWYAKQYDYCKIKGVKANTYTKLTFESECMDRYYYASFTIRDTWTIHVIQPVTQIKVSPTSKTLKVGETVQLTKEILPSDATYKDVKWSSGDSKVAKVDSNGKVTAVGKGKTNIYCTHTKQTNEYDWCSITVEEAPILVTEIKLNKNSIELDINKTEQLKATVLPSNATNKSVTWSSNKPSVATVDENGKVTGINSGDATITCKANDGSGVKAECTVRVGGFTEINATNFPDENFRNYLLSQDYGKDGKLTESEIKNCYSIDVKNKGIKSLKGVELFANLKRLYINENQLTSLDVSKNTALTDLVCNNNQLTSLDVSKNTALEWFPCNNNKLTSLDVSNNPQLQYLNCSYNQLSSLVLPQDDKLDCLYCNNNQLTSLDVSKLTALTSLSCGNNQLTSLDVSKLTALTSLSCYDNQLTSLNVSKLTALTTLYCYNNQLSSLDVSKLTALTSLSCYDNQLTSLNVSKLTALTTLYCYNNQLSSLDVSKLTALTSLSCGNNQLTSLDVSKLTALTSLSCGNNQLTSLDVSNLTVLTSLSCGNNQLTSLTVSKNTTLKEIWCQINQIKGEAMDKFISGLLENNTSEVYKLNIYSRTAAKEGNRCTKAQVNAIKAKGWTPQEWNGTEWVVLNDGAAIESITIDNPDKDTRIFNLRGQRLDAPQKGINIVNGKKVLVK